MERRTCTETKKSEAARKAILEGVNALADPVKATLGAGGRTAIIQDDYGKYIATKDGVSIARTINPQGTFEAIGAEIIKQAASKTNLLAGDGTTTSIVLAQAAYIEGLKYLATGVNPIELKRGMDAARAAIVKALNTRAKKITKKNLLNIAKVSANNDAEIGRYVANAFEKVGGLGHVMIDRSKTRHTFIDIVGGMQFDRGFTSPYFLTDPAKRECVLENPLLLIWDKKIDQFAEIVAPCEAAIEMSRPIVIICRDVERKVLEIMSGNVVRGAIKACIIKAPAIGSLQQQILEDIAIFSGGEVISDNLGNEFTGRESFGQCEKITVKENSTLMVGGNGGKAKVASRIGDLKKQLEDAGGKHERDEIQQRIGNLSGGVAVIYVGGKTDVEAKEMEDRIEDSINATRASIEEGIIEGGGVGLAKAVSSLQMPQNFPEDQKRGYELVKKIGAEPLKLIAANSGVNGEVIYNKVMGSGLGYNVLTREYEDFFKTGILDPVKVTRLALENGVSVAGTLLTTESVIATIKKNHVDRQ